MKAFILICYKSIFSTTLRNDGFEPNENMCGGISTH
jgi:hypothetical protein